VGNKNADAQNNKNCCHSREHGQSCATPGGKSAASRTVKVIHLEAEVAAALMIFGNSGWHEVIFAGTKS
jgi:hypothetical protein